MSRSTTAAPPPHPTTSSSSSYGNKTNNSNNHHHHNHGTFQPMVHRSGTLRERLHSYTKRTLGAGGSINEAVALPPGESCAAWVAVHAIDFYNDVSTIWAVMATDPYLASFRPGEGFPSGVEYRWSSSDNNNGSSTTVSVSAPVYIDKVLHWIAQQMNDETKFPNDNDTTTTNGNNNNSGEEYALRVFQTPAFAALCGQIFRRLFRVYGIIYSSFFGTLEALDMAPHLNSCFKHFMYFCTEFGLLPEREIEPLEVLVRPIRKQYYHHKSGNTTTTPSNTGTTNNNNNNNNNTSGGVGTTTTITSPLPGTNNNKNSTNATNSHD